MWVSGPGGRGHFSTDHKCLLNINTVQDRRASIPQLKHNILQAFGENNTYSLLRITEVIKKGKCNLKIGMNLKARRG